MTKAELIERVHGKKNLPRDLTKKTVGRIIDAVFLEMGDYFIRTKVTRNAVAKLTYPGFGTFLKRRRGERTVRNPQTGAPILIPAQSTIVFSPGQELRGLLNRNKTESKSEGKTEANGEAKTEVNKNGTKTGPRIGAKPGPKLGSKTSEKTDAP